MGNVILQLSDNSCPSQKKTTAEKAWEWGKCLHEGILPHLICYQVFSPNRPPFYHQAARATLIGRSPVLPSREGSQRQSCTM